MTIARLFREIFMRLSGERFRLIEETTHRKYKNIERVVYSQNA